VSGVRPSIALSRRSTALQSPATEARNGLPVPSIGFLLLPRIAAYQRVAGGGGQKKYSFTLLP
jgi:hypothetical protein